MALVVRCESPTSAKPGARGLILSRDKGLEAAVVDGLALYPVETLEDVAALLRGERFPETRSVDPRSLFRQAAEHGEDLRDVKGQELVKRTLEIAAAGTEILCAQRCATTC